VPEQHNKRTEKEVRRDLAAAYRLAAMEGWGDTIYTHLSATVPDESGVYLINQYGLTMEEVTASNLVKVDLAGAVVDGTKRKVNPTGFAIHGAIHKARQDVECVIHLHAPWSVALSIIPEGLIPASQWAMRFFKRIGRHPYEGLALGEKERTRLVRNLGQLDGVILENHGLLMVGRTVSEAYMLTLLFEKAARAQLRAMAATGGQLMIVAEEVVQLTQAQWIGNGSIRDGDDEWPAMLRKLERVSPDYQN
jgi:ribulose-5-phosphate 4-epimerase/fuculose-1-phosphate aldolase